MRPKKITVDKRPPGGNVADLQIGTYVRVDHTVCIKTEHPNRLIDLADGLWFDKLTHDGVITDTITIEFKA